MKLQLKQDCLYSEVIHNYFANIMHKTIIPTDKELLNILTTILVGDKNIRLGPSPSIEQLAEIRKVISHCMANKSPIPILVAWGGRKTVATDGVDTAELSALNQLMRMDDSIKTYFSPGIKVNIRIEDTGADWLYRSETNSFQNIERYSSQFESIVKAFTSKYNINPIRESKLMSSEKYFRLSHGYSMVLTRAIKNRLADLSTEKEMDILKEAGWKGDLPLSQIDHYMNRYRILYPDKSEDEYIKMAADYLGGAKARYDLNGRAEPADKFISISFIPPIPGAPVSMFNNVLYYRTVPAKDGRTHIAPWRAKGYLEIDNHNNVKMKVTSYSNKEILNKLDSVVGTFDDNVDIKINYLLEDNEL